MMEQIDREKANRPPLLEVLPIRGDLRHSRGLPPFS